MLHFRPLGRDLALFLGHAREAQLPDGQHLESLVAQDPDVELAPLDVLLDEGVRADAARG
jgi:hypothetical protein